MAPPADVDVSDVAQELKPQIENTELVTISIFSYGHRTDRDGYISSAAFL
jgi:hypothetical protein